jgi:hypothetical protein
MTDENVPKDFGWRYIMWQTWLGILGMGRYFWHNAITFLMLLQASFASVLLIADSPADDKDPSAGPLLPHTLVRIIILANSILCAVLAQIKRSNSASQQPKEN